MQIEENLPLHTLIRLKKEINPTKLNPRSL